MINETISNIVINFPANWTSGIPIIQTTQQSWQQYIPTLVLGGFFILYFLFGMLKQSGGEVFGRIMLYIFKQQNKIKHLMVIKHTKSGLFDMSMIDGNTSKSIQEALIKFNGEPFDVVLYTGGGEIFASEFISRLFKNYKGKIRSFIPVYSMSGGTYLVLSTDEIYMNDYACLGGIDPQLGVLFGGYGSAKGWNKVIKMKKGKANDQSIIMDLMGKQYTKTIKENINSLLVSKVDNVEQRKQLVHLLTSGENQHALPLTKDLLNSYGLKINPIDYLTNKRLLNLLKKLHDGVTYG